MFKLSIYLLLRLRVPITAASKRGHGPITTPTAPVLHVVGPAPWRSPRSRSSGAEMADRRHPRFFLGRAPGGVRGRKFFPLWLALFFYLRILHPQRRSHTLSAHPSCSSRPGTLLRRPRSDPFQNKNRHATWDVVLDQPSRGSESTTARRSWSTGEKSLGRQGLGEPTANQPRHNAFEPSNYAPARTKVPFHHPAAPGPSAQRRPRAPPPGARRPWRDAGSHWRVWASPEPSFPRAPLGGASASLVSGALVARRRAPNGTQDWSGAAAAVFHKEVPQTS